MILDDWIKGSLDGSLGYIFSVCMVVGAVLPYVPQYWTIYKTRSSSGFSNFVCLTLLISNISRIVFWFGKPFDLTLIVQSIIMTIAQITLLELWVRVRAESLGQDFVKRTLISRNGIGNFWMWTDIMSYIEFLTLMTAVMIILMYLFCSNSYFVETFGYVSTISDAVLGIPQLYKNFTRKSVVGLSLAMILMWLVGDISKTFFYIAKDQPLQFLVCGIIQIIVDVLILVQVALYGRGTNMNNNSFQVNDESTVTIEAI